MPFTVSAVRDQRNKYGGNAALNCYLTMPFNKHARIELENQGDFPLTQVCANSMYTITDEYVPELMPS